MVIVPQFVSSVATFMTFYNAHIISSHVRHIDISTLSFLINCNVSRVYCLSSTSRLVLTIDGSLALPLEEMLVAMSTRGLLYTEL